MAREYLTPFQANRLARGQSDHFLLNQYKILDRIGKGRMAGVYKAVHRLGQVVAIKILPPSRARDPQTFARFQREARLAKQLDHPNLVRTFQTAVADDLYYLVMEYLEGETLQEVLQRRRQLPPAEAVRVSQQVLLGLQHIHEQGLVHRDLEPGNIMLVRAAVQAGRTQPTVVKILDIGLGRAVFDQSAPAAGGLRLTTAGTILGTPEYMAPEQGRDSHAVDIRADIYSVGCILYHCLTGQPPFPDKQVVRAMRRHAEETPAPLRQFNPYLPDGLQVIVDRMLAKDPAQRYPTPDDAARELQEFLAGTTAPGAREADPRLQAYLQWLASQAREEDDVIPSPGASSAAGAVETKPPATVSAGAAPLRRRRQWLLISIGAGAVVLGASVAWILVRWVFR